MNKNKIRRVKCHVCGKRFNQRFGMYYCDVCLKEYREHKSPEVLGREKENKDE